MEMIALIIFSFSGYFLYEMYKDYKKGIADDKAEEEEHNRKVAELEHRFANDKDRSRVKVTFLDGREELTDEFSPRYEIWRRLNIYEYTTSEQAALNYTGAVVECGYYENNLGVKYLLHTIRKLEVV